MPVAGYKFSIGCVVWDQAKLTCTHELTHPAQSEVQTSTGCALVVCEELCALVVYEEIVKQMTSTTTKLLLEPLLAESGWIQLLTQHVQSSRTL